MNHSKCLCALAGAVLAVPAVAETEIEDSLPIDLARLFVGSAFGEARFYSDILDDFPDFTVPEDFEVRGSLDQGYSQRVVLRTSLQQEAAEEAITAAFAENGWRPLDLPEAGPGPQVGFVSDQMPTRPLQLCHDALGTIGVSLSAAGEGRLVSLSRSIVQPVPQTCEEQEARRGFFRPGAGLAEYMPRLVMPEQEDGRDRPFMGGGGGGSSNDWESRASIAIDWSADRLFHHFSSQVIEQDWTLDAESIGGLLSTGTWTKSPEDGVELIGILSVLELTDDNYEMRFRVLRTNAGGAGAGIGTVNVIRNVLQ